MIAIIDYDAGNIGSVEKALDFLGEKTIVTEDPVKILNADGVILPGVGAFGGAMARLRARGLEEVIRKCVEREIPFLGICLGQQLLFESSEESPGVKGLHILDGKVMRIPAQEGVKVPHMGWNDLQFPRQGRLFEGLADHTSVYFVHSYYLRAGEEQVVTARAEYGLMIDASVEKGNVFGCQFHPEKSADAGLQILRNFIRVTKG
ncbi:imidazole glycerol phosphate synthase subunit HisH [Lachnospiraceae bacterium]|jgi:glutamine amidotransferase|nr:imidazole glycerol phosphate synthase subunit HisH [Lachnospiraceae bacterium]GFI64783.1 imidazole glycerol phosphate synthase subunit HisH [Lachnospiraceae bacterium]